ncbi:MAG: hypothetical protein IJV04_05200, partial [Lachnospiraceae bacterium]|nr:hypothetical protein [Lachnospiraceae bacterium]
IPGPARWVNMLLFVLLVPVCALLSSELPDGSNSLLWQALPLVTAAMILYAALGLISAASLYRRTLTSSSIQQALDNLRTGVLFADRMDRVLLFNHTMEHLAGELGLGYPQTAGELWHALEALVESNDSDESAPYRIPGEKNLYRFADGRVWHFTMTPLTAPGLEGFCRIAAEDTTDLYKTNAKLMEENHALQATNREMQDMLVRIADRIRQQESLNLKMKIHNEIGASLIALSEQLNLLSHTQTENGKTTEEQLRALQHAVGCFRPPELAPKKGMGDVRRQAMDIHVDLKLVGVMPQDSTVTRVIAAAAQECITNCVRHAKGTLVKMQILEEEDHYRITATNDGLPPNRPITEGSGLSGLRRLVEQSGGTMQLFHAPEFRLEIRI